ncbi:MAG: nucleotide sugar dehydrogenase [Candidatus Peribacteraceae bacterium]|nr:nucleotide sugar dehydrogenase [Candidatus Peribacteraceae bacterium]
MQPQRIAIVGLGYVGLPLAHAFAAAGHNVTGYDISQPRIDALKKGEDWTLELTAAQLKAVSINFTTDPASLKTCDVIILALPTPVDEKNNPDLTPLEKASVTVGKNLKKGAIVVYESTVYPGVTEEICGPILEKQSGLVCGKDFTLGYSPERVNPGDKNHTITKIVKVVAGQDEKTADVLCELYGSIITAGIHRAPSIKVAEMGKAIENAQRDLNIAYVNEIAMLCNAIGIPTKDVLEAAGTKWNFLKFQPGLVGGHCIGVDPYYLVEKAKQLGMKTNVITVGRAVNDGMSGYIVNAVAAHVPKNGKILVLGLTFKENIPDTRNSKAQDVVHHFAKGGFAVEAHDPFITPEEIKKLKMTPGSLDGGPYDAVVFLVPHKEYLAVGVDGMLKATKKGGVIYDLKSLLDGKAVEKGGSKYMAL